MNKFCAPVRNAKDRQSDAVRLTTLPDDVLLNVFGWLPLRDLWTLSQTCKDLSFLSASDELWTPLLSVYLEQHRFPQSLASSSSGTAKATYARLVLDKGPKTGGLEGLESRERIARPSSLSSKVARGVGIVYRAIIRKDRVRAKIVLTGLDAAGKSTILWYLFGPQVEETIPTIGMNLEHAHKKNIEVTCFDVGGGGKIWPLFRHWLNNIHGLVYVVDSNDYDRMEEVKEKLDRVLGMVLTDAPVLVFANKQDLPNAMPPQDVVNFLGLDTLKRPWKVFPVCAQKKDRGLYKGFDWLSDTCKKMEDVGMLDRVLTA